MEDGFLKMADGAELYWRVDDFTDPWTRRPTVLMIHGFGESHESWRAWVPHLARKYRVVRIDRRGFGRSTPMPLDFPWSLDQLVQDTATIIETLSPGTAHLVGAKVGTPLCIRIAATRPELASSLTLAGGPTSPMDKSHWVDFITRNGARAWAELTMDDRMGPEMSTEAKRWWIDLMSKSATSTMIGFLKGLPTLDVTADLPSIRCPTLVLATDTKYRPINEPGAWHRKVADARLEQIPGGGYHVAACQPDLCAIKTREFLEEIESRGPASKGSVDRQPARAASN